MIPFLKETHPETVFALKKDRQIFKAGDIVTVSSWTIGLGEENAKEFDERMSNPKAKGHKSYLQVYYTAGDTYYGDNKIVRPCDLRRATQEEIDKLIKEKKRIAVIFKKKDEERERERKEFYEMQKRKQDERIAETKTFKFRFKKFFVNIHMWFVRKFVYILGDLNLKIEKRILKYRRKTIDYDTKYCYCSPSYLSRLSDENVKVLKKHGISNMVPPCCYF